MKFYKILFVAAVVSFVFGCKNKTTESGFNVTVSPDAGTSYKAGTDVPIKVSYSADVKPDSIVYLLDATRFAVKNDSSVVTLKTDTLKMGVKVITVKVYQGGKDEDAATNIVVLAPKEPEALTFKVEKVFPHDTTSFTEGLEYHDGFLYESDGGTIAEGLGQSSLRKTDLNGKVLQKVDVDTSVFAEGITIIDNKIIQLTYKEKKVHVYDLKTFKMLSTSPFNAAPEGWGLCNDGKQLYTTVGSGSGGGTNQILILNKDNFQKIGAIDVYDDKGPVTDLNELELIDGKFYANIWTKDTIVVIDPKTGAVLQSVDLKNLYPDRKDHNPNADVLNGIAWDAEGKRLFVTGKKWDKLFQVKFVKP
jgi:glutamine cyclotransferase